MIHFERGGDLFTLRVAAVGLHRGRVLLHRSLGDVFWVLPGGRVELRESAAVTVRREMAEELEVDVRVERLLWVLESFFPHDGRDFHEVGLYFLVSLPEGWAHLDEAGSFEGREGEQVIEFRWHALEALGDLDLRPRFLAAGLPSLPPAPVHLVEVDPALRGRVRVGDTPHAG